MTSFVPFAEAFYRTLVVNGRPAVESNSGYVEISLPREDAAHAAEARILAAAPTVTVLFITDPSRQRALIERVERDWPASAPRPVYVIVEGSTTTFSDFIGARAERRHRVFSVSPLDVPTTARRFLMRFDAVYPGETTPTLTPGSTYDGLYALAYATYALGDRPPTGPDLARGLARLTSPGHRLECGPTDLLAGIAALARGESIDLGGVSGQLDFDPSTGEVARDFTFLCPGVDAAGRASGDVQSGAIYVASQQRTIGTLDCP